jgi:hypothetical protein
VQAEINDFKEVAGSGGGITYAAIVSYTTVEGEKIIATAKISTGSRPSVGKEVWIIHSPGSLTLLY